MLLLPVVEAFQNRGFAVRQAKRMIPLRMAGFGKTKEKGSKGKAFADAGPVPKAEPVDMSNYCRTVDLNYPGMRLVHKEPPIFEIDDFFSEEMCDAYIARAQEKGAMYNSQTFVAATSTVRSSTTWYLKYAEFAEFLVRASSLTGKAIETMEDPQIVRYEMGQQFSWHYDALPPSMNKNGGQRVATILLYLNDLNDLNGGATCFKDLNLKVQPKKGKALLFFPCLHDGTPDDRTMHAGQITMDTKWIAQIWLHQEAYTPAVPPGTSHADGIAAVGELQNM